MGTEELLQLCHCDPCQMRHFAHSKCADSHTDGGRNMRGLAGRQSIRNKHGPVSELVNAAPGIDGFFCTRSAF